MRIRIVMLAALISMGTLQAKSGEEGKGIFLNALMEKVDNKRTATYYCEMVEVTEYGYHYKAYFMSGELKMDGWYKDLEMNEAEGPFVFYYQSGQAESQGEYLEGVKFGLWQRFTENGEELPEKLYASHQMMKAMHEAEKEK